MPHCYPHSLQIKLTITVSQLCLVAILKLEVPVDTLHLDNNSVCSASASQLQRMLSQFQPALTCTLSLRGYLRASQGTMDYEVPAVVGIFHVVLPWLPKHPPTTPLPNLPPSIVLLQHPRLFKFMLPNMSLSKATKAVSLAVACLRNLKGPMIIIPAPEKVKHVEPQPSVVSA